jgi:hypothetical protein
MSARSTDMVLQGVLHSAHSVSATIDLLLKNTTAAASAAATVWLNSHN